MALGGGIFTAQNKVLPGNYINFISAAKATAEISERGVATMPLELDWGIDDEVLELDGNEFRNKSLNMFGYTYGHDKMKGLRDVFKNIKTLYVYKLTSGGEKASNDYATACCCGIRGNDLKIIISKNIDDTSKFDVKTVLDMTVIDTQTVSNASELVENPFVKFKADATLAITAASPLVGGTNGEVTTDTHLTYLAKMESFAFNTMGVITEDLAIKALYVDYAKRMREEVGVKFQVVLYDCTADYEGVINVKNNLNLVYWITGIEAGCAVNKSCTNRVYDGEVEVDTDYTQAQLEMAIKAGEMVLHKVGSTIRVLLDVNSLTTVTANKAEVFKENQTIRVLDQIANDIGVLFNTKYLGTIQNNEAGRISLWTDIIKHHEALQNMGAIENFSETDVVIEVGNSKKSVVITDAVTVVNAMEQLYMTVTVE